VSTSLAEGTFLGLTLSNPRGSDDQTPRRQTVRPVILKQGSCLQWTLETGRQQTHQNLTPEESVERTGSLLGDVYRNAHLFTGPADIAVRVTKSGRFQITKSPPSKQPDTAPATHDRQKAYLIPEGTPVPFLQQLGVMTVEGRVKNSRQDRFRQINRFLEFVEDIYDQLPTEGRIEVVDFGCGLSYLTFALHYLLSVIHNRDVRIRGIDRNANIIDRCRQTAVDCDLQGIEFECGPIDALATEAPIHLAVSLHACDTATDDALAAAVNLEAQVILAAPCCQHELFTQLDAEALSLVIRHGILKERFAALATDALRAAVLEQAGYRTQVIEFIETEHTPKNLLLRAVRREPGQADPKLPEKIAALKELLGIEQTRLEMLLGS